VNAKKERYGQDEAIGLLKGLTKMFVAKGKKVTEVDLKNDRPEDDALGKIMLGPTGNLRAPTMKIGKTILIGFHEETYESVMA